MRSIGVLGAGVGGLTVALALREAGLGEIHVYEAHQAGDVANTGVVLSPNATRVLHALGLKDELQTSCSHPQAQLQRSSQRGFLLTQRPLGQFAEHRYGAPHCIIGRAELLSILIQACDAHGVRIHGNHPCTKISQSDDCVVLHFDARRASHDVLIGCDGTTSMVREFLQYPRRATPTGARVWTGSAPIANLPRSLSADAITTWLGPRQFLTHWPSPDGERVEFLATVTDHTSDLASCFATWHPDLGTLIRSSSGLVTEPANEHEPITQWYDKRVVMLGDACHALPPHLQQGAALAMEDAWVLSRMLERWEDDPTAGFGEYQRYRKIRLTRARQASRFYEALWSVESPRKISLRNLKLALANRYLPEITMQQLDWLYGYDCIKGFE